LMRLLDESPFSRAFGEVRATLSGMKHYFDVNWKGILKRGGL